MSEDLQRIIELAETCESYCRPKAFRVLVAFAKDNPDPADSEHHDAWTVPGLKAFTRALLNFHQYEKHHNDWIELCNTGALYCEEALDLMQKPEHFTNRDDHARFYAWNAEFMLQWVYRGQNELTKKNEDQWLDHLDEDEEMLQHAWKTHLQALSLEPTASLAYHLQRAGATNATYAFARHARRAMRFADLTGDHSFMDTALALLVESRMSLKCQGLSRLDVWGQTKETITQLTKKCSFYADLLSTEAKSF